MSSDFCFSCPWVLWSHATFGPRPILGSRLIRSSSPSLPVQSSSLAGLSELRSSPTVAVLTLKPRTRYVCKAVVHSPFSCPSNPYRSASGSQSSSYTSSKFSLVPSSTSSSPNPPLDAAHCRTTSMCSLAFSSSSYPSSRSALGTGRNTHGPPVGTPCLGRPILCFTSWLR